MLFQKYIQKLQNVHVVMLNSDKSAIVLKYTYVTKHKTLLLQVLIVVKYC